MLTSPYVRARQTAGDRPGGGGRRAPARSSSVDERLREKEFGILDRLTRPASSSDYPEQAEQRAPVGKFYHRPPGGESWCDVILRLRSVLDTISLHHAAGERVLIVAHQVIVLCLRYLLEEMTEDADPRDRPRGRRRQLRRHGVLDRIPIAGENGELAAADATTSSRRSRKRRAGDRRARRAGRAESCGEAAPIDVTRSDCCAACRCRSRTSEATRKRAAACSSVAGSAQVPGAVLLAGVAALRAGAGKLQLATVRDRRGRLALAVPEALVVALPEAAPARSPAMRQRRALARSRAADGRAC